MQKLTDKILQLKPQGNIFDDTVVNNLFPNSTQGAIKAYVFKALKAKEIISIKKGLYCLSQSYQQKEAFHPFTLAQKIYWPSFVSFESALRYYGLIPEHVPVITSVSQKRSRLFTTPLGDFKYQHVPTKNFFAGVVVKADEQKQVYHIASPLRAIADTVFLHNSITWKKDHINFLTESLRMEKDDIMNLDLTAASFLLDSLTNKRVRAYMEHFINEVKKWKKADL